jgi:hypothetical protein
VVLSGPALLHSKTIGRDGANLRDLQAILRDHARILANPADVENLTDLEDL